MSSLISIVSILLGGGIGVAIIRHFGDVRVKKMDIQFNERKEFIKELADLRQSIHTLFQQHMELMQENSIMKLKIKELEDHIMRKSLLLAELEKYRAYYEQLKEILKAWELDGNNAILIEKVKNLCSIDVLSR